MKAFEKARQAKDAPPAYNDRNNERAFEEWYADQVAIWAKAAYFKKVNRLQELLHEHLKQLESNC